MTIAVSTIHVNRMMEFLFIIWSLVVMTIRVPGVNAVDGTTERSDFYRRIPTKKASSTFTGDDQRCKLRSLTS